MKFMDYNKVICVEKYFRLNGRDSNIDVMFAIRKTIEKQTHCTLWR